MKHNKNKTRKQNNNKNTRKKRGGLDSFPIGMLDQLSQDTVYNHPQKDDLIRRLNHIYNIQDEDTKEALKTFIRNNPKGFYQLIIHIIQQAEAEHHGGRRKKNKTRKQNKKRKLRKTVRNKKKELADISCGRMNKSIKQKTVTIGIMTAPWLTNVKDSLITSYMASSYVKWLESSGALIVPIEFDLPKPKM